MRSLGAAARTSALAVCTLCASLACDSASKPRAVPSAATVQAQPSASAVPDPHAEHDCSVAHPQEPRPPPSTATALSREARSRLTKLRISAHVGNVIIRKTPAGWTIGGPSGCTVAPARIERALSNLSALSAVKSDERFTQATDFQLQLIALIGEERALHFDIANRQGGADLVQLGDQSTVRLRGLDRDLWSTDPGVWCAPGTK